MPNNETLTTDDFEQYLIDDGFTIKRAHQIANEFTRANGFDKYGGNGHDAFSLYAADKNYVPNKPGTNKNFYSKYKINTNIKTKKGTEKQQRKTRLRVLKALKSKREKRLAKDRKKQLAKNKKAKVSRKRTLRIGCAFHGLGFIKEYEDDLIYIPPSDYCLIRCVEKATGKHIDRKGLNPYGNSLTKLRMSIKNSLSIKDIPSIISIEYNLKDDKKDDDDINEDVLVDEDIDEEQEVIDVLTEIEEEEINEDNVTDADYVDEDDEDVDDVDDNNIEVTKKFTPIDKAKKKIEKFKIVLCYINNGEYHAYLIKLKDDEVINQKMYNLRYEHMYNNLDYVTNLNLSDDQVKIELPKHKKIKNKCVVFDIETYSNIIKKTVKDSNNKDIEIETRQQIPEGVAYCFLDFETMTHTKVMKCTGPNCYTNFLNSVTDKFELDEILFYSHNGGCFDNLYAKGLKTLTLKKQIKHGRVKMIEAIHNSSGKTLIFLDSISFLKASLDKACDFFETENKKTKFDIKNKNRDFFLKNKEWVDYMKQDVTVLAEIVLKFEKMVRTFGESMTTSMCGISSMAWNILCSRSFGMNKVFRSKDPTTQDFIHNASYGGRIIHNKKRFDCKTNKSKGLICLDGNSLYPSAMYIGEYPVGKFRVMDDKTNVKTFIETYLGQCPFIAEVTLDAGNIRYPLIPYRTEQGCIIYPNGVFTGVYTSVEIEEAINDGYKILSFKRGIYWTKGKKIFSNTIEDLFNKRTELKNEKNPMEYIYKIMLNSIYGYMAMTINDTTIFSKEEKPKISIGSKITSTSLLKNGQYEHHVTFRKPLIKKPAHIGAFIMSNARKIMNNYIRQIGPQNIYYGDTDSLYVPVECLKNIKESNELCGLKNDYGKGRLITYALFLDTKRYYLEFNKEDKDKSFYKAKFNGINFIDDNSLKNWIDGDDKKAATKKLYEWFYNNPDSMLDDECKIIQQKWSRNCDNVVISDYEMSYQVSPEVRYNWDKDTSYPIKLNKSGDYVPYNCDDVKFMIISKPKQTKFTNTEPYLYEVCQFGLFSAMPLTYDKLDKSKDVTISKFKKEFKMKKINKNFKTSFIKSTKTNKIYKRVGNDFFIYNNTKAQEKVDKDEIGDYEELLIIKHTPSFPKLTSNDIDIILEGVECCLKDSSE